MRHSLAIAVLLLLSCSTGEPESPPNSSPPTARGTTPGASANKAKVTVMWGDKTGPTIVIPEPGLGPGEVQQDAWQGPLLLTASARGDGSFDAEAKINVSGSVVSLRKGQLAPGVPFVIVPENDQERAYFGGSADPVTITLQ